MASAVTNLQYRTIDELIDSVRLDMSSYNLTGDIDAAMLIKVAQKINYELGLKIYMPKETVLEIDNRRARLPADFHQLQLALLCHNYRHLYYPVGLGANGALQLYEQPPVYLDNTNLTTCPCWTVTANKAQVPVTQCDGTIVSTFFPANDDGSDKVTKVCALFIDVQNVHGGTISVTTSSFCYNDINASGFTCTKPDPPCAVCTVPVSCGGVDGDPFKQDHVRSICNGDINVTVVQGCGTPGTVRYYEHFERMYIVPNRQADAFCVNTQFRDCYNKGSIYNGFLETSVDCGKVYISYLGGLEDDSGNLLVLDHPKINYLYEFSLKKTILENLYLNGEPDIERRLQYIDKQLDEYRQQALSVANTADYRQLINAARVTRNMNNRRYVWPLDKWHGYLGFVNNVDYI